MRRLQVTLKSYSARGPISKQSAKALKQESLKEIIISSDIYRNY